jgi:arsenite transporter
MLHYIHEFECKICTRKLLDQHRFKSVSLRSGCHNTATGQGGYAYGKDDIVSDKTAAVNPGQAAENPGKGLGLFERFLSLWVALCIVIGVAIGQLIPAIPDTLMQFTYAEVNIPIAILIWFMIYPMMVQIDFSSILGVRRQPRGLGLTLVVNWLIKPFTMFFFAWLFLRVIFAPLIPAELATEYIAGAILLGAAPCTAMVFVWSYLTKGDPAYTLVQVSVNDLIMLFAFAPIVALLLGLSDILVPWDTLMLSVVLYIVVPLAAGYITRVYLIRTKGLAWFDNVFLKRLGPVTIIGLLLTLILLFSFQGEVILNNPLHIALIAVPLVIQTFFIFAIAYSGAKALKIPHQVAAPAAMIGASNFFELAVATAIALFGVTSGAALAAVVGVLVEVPVMLILVRIANKTRHHFPTAEPVKQFAVSSATHD